MTSLNTDELKDSRGTANFNLKWSKDSRKAAYLNVVPIKGVTRHMTEADDLVWVPFIGFDCRGLDVIGFHPEVSSLSTANQPCLFSNLIVLVSLSTLPVKALQLFAL